MGQKEEGAGAENTSGVRGDEDRFSTYEVLAFIAATSGVLALCMMALTIFMTERYKAMRSENENANQSMLRSEMALFKCQNDLRDDHTFEEEIP